MTEDEDQHCRILLLCKEVWCPYIVEEQTKIKECCMCIYYFTALSKSLPHNLHLIYALLCMCTLNHRVLWCHNSNYIATKFCLSNSLSSTQFHNIKTLFHNWFIGSSNSHSTGNVYLNTLFVTFPLLVVHCYQIRICIMYHFVLFYGTYQDTNRVS